MKEENQFSQWENRTFGAGYGTGELPILKAVKVFFDSLEDREYDYKILEKKLGDTVTWLLINAFEKQNMIEWGTSARYGWITACGEYVKDYIKDKTPEQLYEILMAEHNEPICECNGEMKESGHQGCGKNPMVNEEYANKLKYSTPK